MRNGIRNQESGIRSGILILILASYFLIPASISAQSVDILWQGYSYTTPFYQGRTLWSKQSRITLVAIPQGLGDPLSLNYKWTRDGTVLGSLSGVGKNTLTYLDSILSKPQSIKVEIIAGQKTVLASNTENVVPLSPSLAIYENNPLYGYAFHREVGGSYKLIDKEITFASFPLFFSTSSRFGSQIGYQWQTNVGGIETSNTVTYRAPEGESGSSEVKVKVDNKNQITQSAERTFLVQFRK